MQKWEYKIIIRMFNKGKYEWSNPPNEKRSYEEFLNALGQEGWELISTLPVSVPNQAWDAGATKAIHYLLKRPVSSGT
jgi:hypothetical protein